MRIPRKITSNRKHKKELKSIAKLSGSICFIEKLLRDKRKKWTDVSGEIYNILNILNAKLARYSSLSQNEFTRMLIQFAKSEINNCNSVIDNYKCP